MPYFRNKSQVVFFLIWKFLAKWKRCDCYFLVHRFFLTATLKIFLKAFEGNWKQQVTPLQGVECQSFLGYEALVSPFFHELFLCLSEFEKLNAELIESSFVEENSKKHHSLGMNYLKVTQFTAACCYVRSHWQTFSWKFELKFFLLVMLLQIQGTKSYLHCIIKSIG